MSPEQNDGFSHEGDDIADVDKQPCYLLELAPELRNRIYEDVLVENKRVPINKGLRPPALLHTCKQVRDEATKLWLHGNNFCIHIRNCDARRLISFYDVHHDAIMAIRNTGGLRVAYRLSGRVNWTNLLKWCRGVYESKVGFSAHSEDDGPVKKIVKSALRVSGLADSMMEWENCQVALEELRQVAGLVDRDWLKDWDNEVDRGDHGQG